jgi:hypothetical protein
MGPHATGCTTVRTCTPKVRGDIALGSISAAKVRHRRLRLHGPITGSGRDELERSRQGDQGGCQTTTDNLAGDCLRGWVSQALPGDPYWPFVGEYPRWRYFEWYWYSALNFQCCIIRLYLKYVGGQGEEEGQSVYRIMPIVSGNSFQCTLKKEQNVAQSSPVKPSACCLVCMDSGRKREKLGLIFFSSFPPLEHHA